MTSAQSRPPAGVAGRRTANRLVLLAFAVCGFAFLILPYLVIWWGSLGLCPSTVTTRGKFSGTAWEVLRADCGKDGTDVVWQLRVIPDKGYSTVVMESRGGPEPVGWEQAGFEGTVLLSAAPAGETTTRITVKLDPKGQPLGLIEFRDGKRKS